MSPPSFCCLKPLCFNIRFICWAIIKLPGLIKTKWWSSFCCKPRNLHLSKKKNNKSLQKKKKSQNGASLRAKTPLFLLTTYFSASCNSLHPYRRFAWENSLFKTARISSECKHRRIVPPRGDRVVPTVPRFPLLHTPCVQLN